MGPDEVCDVIDFLDSAPWPLSRPEVHRLAAERFGWEIEESRGKEYLVNTVSCLSEADVSVASGHEYAMEVTMCATDVVRDVTEESRRFLADAHALLVREGQERWGAPRVKRDSERQRASWDTGAGGRVRFSGSDRSVRVSYRTPQDMELERDLRR